MMRSKKSKKLILLISLLYFLFAIGVKLVSALKVGIAHSVFWWDILGVIIFSFLVVYIVINLKKQKQDS